MLEPKRSSSFVFFEAAFDLLQIFGAHTWCGFHRLHIVLIDCHPSNPFGVWIYISYFIASEIRQNRNKRLTTICGQKSARNFSIFFLLLGLKFCVWVMRRFIIAKLEGNIWVLGRLLLPQKSKQTTEQIIN